MCFEPRFIYACGCERPKYEEAPIPKELRCAIGHATGRDCVDFLRQAFMAESTRLDYECSMCVEKAKKLGSESCLGATIRKVKSKVNFQKD
jgi:hypothetical protein